MSGPNSHDEPVFLNDGELDTMPVVREEATSPEAGDRPGSLTAICVLAIILGGGGLLLGCVGLTSQLSASRVQKMLAGMQEQARRPGADVQREMNARMMAITNRYKWVTVPLMAAKILVEAALLAGAIMSLGLKPRGRSWLLCGLAAAAVFEAVHAVPTILVQRETQAVMREMMPKMMEAQQGENVPPPGFENLMSSVFSAAGVVSLVVAVVWLSAKIVFCVVGIRYLRRPEVCALFTLPADETFEVPA